jgi:hypothetical protein
MNALRDEADRTLGKIHRGEELTPDVAGLQAALRTFRTTVNRELGTRL